MLRYWDTFWIFLRLGLTSFGGPVAHLSFFRQAFVQQKKWLTEEEYADLIALCTFLPGPASSQVGMAVGALRAGAWGAVCAWLGFTLPSFVIMYLLSLGVGVLNIPEITRALHMVAIAVIFSAVLNMAVTLTPDVSRKILALVAVFGLLLSPYSYTMPLLMLLGGLYGKVFFSSPVGATPQRMVLPSRGYSSVFVVLFTLSFFPWSGLFGSTFQAGSLVFGGGHVVLPLLQPLATWLTPEDFMAGYALAQALPGPVFSITAFLGAAHSGLMGAVVATVGIFLPAFLLIMAVLPIWHSLRHSPLQSILKGTNSIVVGMLCYAGWQALRQLSPAHIGEYVAVGLAFWAIHKAKIPAQYVVLLAMAFGYALTLL